MDKLMKEQISSFILYNTFIHLEIVQNYKIKLKKKKSQSWVIEEGGGHVDQDYAYDNSLFENLKLIFYRIFFDWIFWKKFLCK